MSLPAPDLDDRRFQDLVDDAKRLVQQRCPEWTDHNVSDPGVTLIETFAYMVDQLFYRLNRVPDRMYVKFLELVGVRLFPPTAARSDVTFWLTSPAEETLTIAAGTEVATKRTESEEAVMFTTVAGLNIVPCEVSHLASAFVDQPARHHPETVAGDAAFNCFQRVPVVGDALLVGLSQPVPSCAVALQFESGAVEGVGVDPRNPPIVWEAWTGSGWTPCELDHDNTGGLNRSGEVVLHVPEGHTGSLIDNQRAAWLRCRVIPRAAGQPPYSASPRVATLTGATVGGTTPVVQAETIADEWFGTSEGVPGQRFTLERRPVIPGEKPIVVESEERDGTREWQPVNDFAASGPTDRHFRLDATSGEIAFGPAVREADGSLRQYGAIPEKGAALRVRFYRTGGGRRGNVAIGAISIVKSQVTNIRKVENRRPARGGVDPEDIENAKLRGPLALQTRNRAVTAADYEQLARQAVPEVARVRCTAPSDDPSLAGVVRVLLVPAAPDDEKGRLRFEDLVPAEETLRQLAEYLDERRIIGTRLVVEPPRYHGITVVAQLRARPGTDTEALERKAIETLYRYFHPLSGGPDGDGWPFGRPVQVGDVYAVLQPLPGVELVDDVRLFPTDPLTTERAEAVQRLAVDPNALVYSYEHLVRVVT